MSAVVAFICVLAVTLFAVATTEYVAIAHVLTSITEAVS